MRGIARTLKHQKLRKRFPEGVSMFIHQVSPLTWKLRIICLKQERLKQNCVFGTLTHDGGESGREILTSKMSHIEKVLRQAGVTPIITPKEDINE